MNKKVLRTLEFEKITERLSDLCDSPFAKERARRIKPLCDRGKIISLQAETSASLNRILRYDKPSFSGLRDIRPHLKLLAKGSTLGISELLDIERLLEIAKSAKNSDAKVSDQTDVLSGIFHSLSDIPDVQSEISRCIKGPDEMADDASATLSKIRHTITGMDSRIHDQLARSISSSQNMLRDSLATLRDGRYCLPVKSEYKASFPGIVHDRSATGSTLFIEPMAIVDLNNELSEWLSKEQAEIERILVSLCELTAPYTDELEKDFLLLSDLDFIFAKGELSKQMRASEPIFNGPYIELKKARHPLINEKKVVPIDVSLARDYDLLVITGPNTGGKTVTLKTVGLLSLMGQAGLHIPAADRSHLRVFDEIFADIGDEQSIEQSLSTFSSHMTNTVSILKKATPKSLVLFDELGAGTDPTEGAALAISILNHLHSKKICAMATTHYSELKLYALSEPGVENASCEFDVEKLAPTYRLLVGVPGKSNAFAIASKLGLAANIIEEAAGRIDSGQQKFEDVVTDLNETRADAEREREKAIRFRENAESYKKKLQDKEDRLDKSRDKIIRRANEEAREILERAKQVADESIRKYNKWMNDPEALRAMEKERSVLRDHLDEVNTSMADTAFPKSHKTSSKKAPDELLPGDIVMVRTMGVKGTVSTAPIRGKCYVQIGVLRTEVDAKDLDFLEAETVQAKKEASISSSRSLKSSKAMSVHTEINLIGMTVAEASPRLEKYLDDAYIAHLSQVRIIHGMGTGALRAAVHDILKRTKNVESFRLGEQGEGGYGATVAYFKY